MERNRRIKLKPGRKSLREEMEDYEWHKQLWAEDQDMDALIEKIRSRTFAVKDVAKLKMMKGDARLLTKIVDKLIPNVHEISGRDGKPLEVRWLQGDENEDDVSHSI